VRSQSAVTEGEIQIAIGVEITGHDRQGSDGGGEIRGRSEGPITNPEQYRNIVALAVCHCEILDSVPIEIAHGYGGWRGSGRVSDGKSEGAVSLAQHDLHGVTGGRSHGDVQLAIADEIANHGPQRQGCLSRGVTLGCLERA